VAVANAVVAIDQTGHQARPSKLRGRPPFNWGAFHVEIAMRIKSNSFPEKQEALIADMQKWCCENWQQEVGRSTILQKVKPYYDALANKSKRAT
jgi:hypothetical protein